MSRLKITSTCNGCGLSGTQEGDDAVIVMRAIRAAHDVLKPGCGYSTPPTGRCDNTTRRRSTRGGAEAGSHEVRCEGKTGHVGAHRGVFDGDVVRWAS